MAVKGSWAGLLTVLPPPFTAFHRGAAADTTMAEIAVDADGGAKSYALISESGGTSPMPALPFCCPPTPLLLQ